MPDRLAVLPQYLLPKQAITALAGKLEPAVFAAHLKVVAQWYNHAYVLVERNNHGHAVLLWLRDHGRVPLGRGHDGQDGWLSNSKGKALLYDRCADAFRERGTVLHSFGTFAQLASIEGASLRAPQGATDAATERAAASLDYLVDAGRIEAANPILAGNHRLVVPNGVPRRGRAEELQREVPVRR